MKIGYDAKRLYNNFTGLGNYSRTLVGNLQRSYPGNAYYLYTPRITRTPETALFSDNANFVTRLRGGLRGAYWRTFSIKSDLRCDGVDIFHGLSHELPVGIARTGIKSVVTMHDVMYRTFPDMYTLVDRVIYDIKFKYSCKYADRIVAISESTKNDVVRLFGTPAEKVEVIYQAVDPLFYTMQSSESVRELLRSYTLPPEFILYVGSINSRKNLLNVVKAYALLPEELRIPLVVIGQGRGYKKQVEEFVHTHNLSEQIVWIGNLRDTQTLQAFYQAARLFVFPSFYEGFGLPVAESLFCRTPVVTSNTSSLPEAGGPGALYADPHSTEQIADAMQRLLTDRALCDKLIDEGYDYVHRMFDPQRLTEQMHQLYEKL